MAWMICTHIHTHTEFTQVTNSMEQNHSREAGDQTANQETPHLSWNQKVHYGADRSPLCARTCIISCNTLVLWVTNCETIPNPQAERPIFCQETINFEGYPQQILHLFLEDQQVGISLCMRVVPQVRKVAITLDSWLKQCNDLVSKTNPQCQCTFSPFKMFPPNRISSWICVFSKSSV
jgi:hypothetical protein